VSLNRHKSTGIPREGPLHDVLVEETVEVEESITAVDDLLSLTLQHRHAEPADGRQEERQECAVVGAGDTVTAQTTRRGD